MLIRKLFRVLISLILSGSLLGIALLTIPTHKLYLDSNQIISEKGKIYFDDLNKDGSPEMIHFFYYDRIQRSCIHIFNDNHELIGMVDFEEKPVNDFDLIIVDPDADLNKEINFLSHNEDSVIWYTLKYLEPNKIITTKSSVLPYLKKSINYIPINITQNVIRFIESGNSTTSFVYSVDKSSHCLETKKIHDQIYFTKRINNKIECFCLDRDTEKNEWMIKHLNPENEFNSLASVVSDSVRILSLKSSHSLSLLIKDDDNWLIQQYDQGKITSQISKLPLSSSSKIKLVDLNHDNKHEYILSSTNTIQIFNHKSKLISTININDSNHYQITFKSTKNREYTIGIFADNLLRQFEYVRNPIRIAIYPLALLLFYILYTISTVLCKRYFCNNKDQQAEEDSSVIDSHNEIASVIENIQNSNPLNGNQQKSFFAEEDIESLINQYSTYFINKYKCQFGLNFLKSNPNLGFNSQSKFLILHYIDFWASKIAENQKSNNISLQGIFTDETLEIFIESRISNDFNETKLHEEFSNTNYDFTGEILISNNNDTFVVHMKIPNEKNISDESEKIKVIIAEDHDVTIFGLINIFKRDKSIQVVGTAKNGYDVLDLLEDTEVDIVVTDIAMPGMDGIELAERINKDFPFIKLIVFTMYMENWFVERLKYNKVKGFVSKSSKIQELIEAIHAVNNDDMFYCSQFSQKYAEEIVDSSTQKKNIQNLTQNEFRILQLLAKNLEPYQIAQELVINHDILEKYISALKVKFDCSDDDCLKDCAKDLDLYTINHLN